HFGLGRHEQADVMRVVWSNGVPQNRFDPEKNQTVLEHQTLKGSCPWLYAWNGREYTFVTDVLWSSALGMPLGINAGETQYVHAFSNSTDEYLKVPGNTLKPKQGRYSLQFTDELWESPYVDRVQLLTVDHPDSVDIYVDEHFTPPPFPPLKIYPVVHKRFPLSARDDKGHDELSVIREKDGRYVSDLTPARYQGMMETHELTLDLGAFPSDVPVHLFLYGWVFPTDASINTSIAQSDAVQTIGPLLQMKDPQSHWQTVIESLGFPKGKNKTVIVNLTNKFLSADHHVRIRTNLEIYWDQIFFTVGEPAVPVRTTRLNPVSADFHYRGFSKVSRATPYSPHIPDYSQVTTAPKWRDLTGYYTRYGDVRDLLLQSDSKYVIMNAGDEITLEFAAKDAPEIPAGWTRDFLFYNDGWLKDGDLNTATGQTVKPLPFQGMSQYPYGPEESYPQDADHQQYLKEYNTRRVNTDTFRRMVYRYEAAGK
ncbi:MAG: hypothetical protein P8Y60_18370, partial [Calditrichota bacterium]